MTTLFTLISNAASYDQHTAWLLNHLNRNLPEDAEVREAAAEVLADPIPEFRKQPGGLVKIGEHVVGNARGAGYFDGKVGRWPEMKEEIFTALRGGAPAPAKATKKVVAPVKAKTTKAVKAPSVKKTDNGDSEDFLVCEDCGRHVSYEEGLVRIGGKRVCGKCCHARRAHVNVPNPDAID